MRNIYLIARRDYLGYVTAFGFWLGVILTPLIIVGSMFVPTMLRDNQPVRYYTVIEQGSEFTDTLARELEDSRLYDIQRDLRDLALSQPDGFDPASLQRFQQARLDGATAEEALETADPGVKISLPDKRFSYVPPPADSIEGLQPYLVGQASLDVPEGYAVENAPPELFAAFIVAEDGSTITYVSEDVVNSALSSAGRRASTEIARQRLLSSAGLTSLDIQTAEAQAAPVIPQKANASGEVATVSMADRAPFFSAMIIGFVLWFLIFSVVNYLITGTIEERSNKIFDTLLTSVRLPELLAGKLLAVLTLALTLIGSWALGAFAVSTLIGGDMPQPVIEFLNAFGSMLTKPGIIIPTVISFVLGYLVYGAIFLAIGSLCESLQEAQTLMSPLLIILMVPLLMLTLAISDPKSPILVIASWIPLFTPFLLILRLPNELPAWEVWSLVALMAVTATVVIWAATKVYRAGAVHGASVGAIGKMFGRGKAKPTPKPGAATPAG